MIQASSGYEAYVTKALKERIKLKSLEQYFGEIIVPTEEVIEIRGGQKRKSERKFFPGYVLVEMEMNDLTCHMVRNTPCVLGFIGGERPAPTSDAEVARILRHVEDGENRPKPKVLFEVGDVVCVTDGPFAMFEGVVERIDYQNSRVILSVSIHGRLTPVGF